MIKIIGTENEYEINRPLRHAPSSQIKWMECEN